ncbi:MAG: tRNA lysidine(34) synthetase TilS [Dehalococcoidia bacterium]|jgi:tRNA(Ile)-lysidine synthase
MANRQNKPSIEQRVYKFIREKQLITAGQRLVLAVSGGPDSVCMLDILAKLRDELGVEMHVTHLNHQLRGAESDADAEYVAELAGRIGIPATVESRDVTAYQKKNGLSPEEAAREVRYAFLAETARKLGAERIAAGHTADDNVETILMHLIRGSGTRGLRGLMPETVWTAGNESIIIIRPLLEMSRADTEKYCKQNNLNPRRDTSNASLVPLRNRVRHELLPRLREYNPNITASLLRTSRIAGDDLAFLDAEAEKFRKRIIKKQKGTIIFDRKAFNALPTAMKRHLLRTSADSLLGNIKDIEAAHIEEIMNILDKPSGKKAILPAGLTFVTERDRYLLGSNPAVLSPYPPLGEETRLEVPGKTFIPGWAITADVLPKAPSVDEDDEYSARFDFDITGDKLLVRKRKPGDRFQPLGMAQSKKINEFMIDAGIPQSWRSRVPMVCAGERIVWMVGQRIDERFKVTETTRRILRLSFIIN